GGHVDAVVTGVFDRGAAHAHVQFLGTRLPQQGDDFAAGGAPDDGIVHQDDPFTPHDFLHGVQFHFDAEFPLALHRLDEGALHVVVFDEPHAIGNARAGAVADGG